MKKKTTPKAKVKTVTNKSLYKGIGGGGIKNPKPKK